MKVCSFVVETLLGRTSQITAVVREDGVETSNFRITMYGRYSYMEMVTEFAKYLKENANDAIWVTDCIYPKASKVLQDLFNNGELEDEYKKIPLYDMRSMLATDKYHHDCVLYNMAHNIKVPSSDDTFPSFTRHVAVCFEDMMKQN